MRQSILVVDDDEKIVTVIRLYLERDNYHVLVAYDGVTALTLARQKQPSLLILDWLLPQINGLDLCRILRAEGNIPIIMLTAKAAEDDTLLGFSQGVDDYVTKPFRPRELVARVRVLLRRVSQENNAGPTTLSSGKLVLYLAAHEVRIDGKPILLTPTEFKLLETLMRDPGRAWSREELVVRVFGHNYDGLERTIDVHLMNVRKKIEPQPACPQYVHTVYGVGYKFYQEPQNTNA